jgi:hypothetical protein
MMARLNSVSLGCRVTAQRMSATFDSITEDLHLNVICFTDEQIAPQVAY